MIFYFSSQPGEQSSQTSGFFTNLVQEVLENRVPEKFLDFTVRKAAHMFVYFILGCSMTLLIGQVVALKVISLYSWQVGLLSFLFCFAYACSDEWHQTFVPGRDGNIRDVAIDGIGFCFAILLVLLCKRIVKWRKEAEV